MNKISILIITTLVIVAVTSCFTNKHNQHIALTSDKYNPDSNTTSFYYLGDYSINVEIPGKWKYIGFNNDSRDYTFRDSLNQMLFIFKGGRGTSSFNKNNLDGDDFIDLFYKWDSEYYLANNPNLKAKIVKRVSNKYLVGEYVDSTYQRTFLYGTLNENGVRIGILSKTNKNIQTEFVSTIYHNLK